jgi:hypothetical protein
MHTRADRRANLLGDITSVFPFPLVSGRYFSERISDERIRDQITNQADGVRFDAEVSTG